MDWRNIEQQIAAVTGEVFELDDHRSVGGGCINTAQKISGRDGRSFFIKFNSADRLDMFEAEADGLRELANAQAVLVPRPIATGVEGRQAYIVMEYLPFGGRDSGAMAHFGAQLARMHRCTKEQYGWHRDNTIGSTPQPNHREDDWLTFWRRHRLGFQLEMARGNGIGRAAVAKGERLLDGMESLFDGHSPEASLLHGDLWSGNYAITTTGEPVIFDPAVYFGDREADLAMTELFGAFGRDFYAAYNNEWPLESSYPVRKTFYNLYHILNHFNMFGGGYGMQADAMLDRLLAEI